MGARRRSSGAPAWLWPIDARRASRLAAARARRSACELAPDALALLAERTEGNLLAAAQELDKLALLAVAGRRRCGRGARQLHRQSPFDVAQLDRALTQADAAAGACGCWPGCAPRRSSRRWCCGRR